ncbi:MAG: 4-hydroxy-tetrahydrodipicolinate synthase [Candidatus Nanopelagicales bacterium]|nr:4-hydroxy-tetrahydrodipicolinate synthase [Candidatus Nanopelagicales bacterium]MDZ4249550.1 4-hydroxy-tetrahydrodipicolinate synthase [Candidatus Nanopelagicales bacterium]
MFTDPQAPFGRVLTAMVTPFDKEGAVDFAAAERLASDLVDLGNEGIVVNGTTGESPTTSDGEKRQLVRTVVEAVGSRACVIAGVGTNDTAHSQRMAREAAEAEADALLVVTPYYSKPPQPDLIRHFIAVADTCDLPVMLYDIPGRSGVPLTHETLVRLSEHPRILANKDAKGDLFAAQRVMRETDLVYYSGDDGLNLPLLSVGAAGFVSVIGHLVADRLLAMHEAYVCGEVGKAREINETLIPVVTGVMTRTQGVIMVKAALDLLGRPGGGMLRGPLSSADAEQRKQLRADLRAGGFNL